MAGAYVRFGGYLGRNGPPPDYVGGGVALAALWSAVVARRRPLTWLLVFMAAVSLLLALGSALLLTPSSLTHVWLPWRALSKLPILKEILADQFAPFLTLFLAFLLAVGLDAFSVAPWRPTGRRRGRHARATSWLGTHRAWVTAAATAVVGVVALVPVFVTFDVPFTVVPVRIPAYLREVAPGLPAGTVLLTVPFAVSGSTPPMLWQAADDMHFRLAGAALKTPNAAGGPVGSGAPGSARRILSNLTVLGGALPTGTPTQVATVRRALRDVGGGAGGDRGRQPRPGVRIGVLHRGARSRAGLRARRLGVDGATGGPDGRAGDGCLLAAVPCRGGCARRPWPTAGDVAVRAGGRGSCLSRWADEAARWPPAVARARP